jgi:hypothetical protein
MNTALDLHTYKGRYIVHCLLFDAAEIMGKLHLTSHTDAFALAASVWYQKVTNQAFVPHTVQHELILQMELLYNEGSFQWNFMLAISRFLMYDCARDVLHTDVSNTVSRDPPSLMLIEVYQLFYTPTITFLISFLTLSKLCVSRL